MKILQVCHLLLLRLCTYTNTFALSNTCDASNCHENEEQSRFETENGAAKELEIYINLTSQLADDGNIFPGMDLPFVTNLNEILAPFRSLKCFVLLDNFGHANIPELSYPLVLRRLAVGHIHMKNNSIWQPWKWIPVELLAHVTATENSSRLIYPCQLSKFFTSKNFPKNVNGYDMFSRIDLLQYPSFSKPWNCEIQIHLYPPTISKTSELKNHDFIRFPPIFQYNLQSRNRVIPSLNFIIHRAEQPINFCNFDMWKHFEDLTTKVYIKLQVFVKQGNEKFLSGISGEIQSYEIINIGISNQVTIPLKNLAALKSPQNLFQAAFPRDQSYYVKTYIYDSWNDLGLLGDEIAVILMPCARSNFYTFGQQNSKTSKLAWNVSQMWLSIFHNFTFLYGVVGFEYCDNGNLKELTRSVFPMALHIKSSINDATSPIFVVKVPVHSDTLNFVACGQKGLQQIAFTELFKVYEGLVWFMILLTIVAVGCLSSMLAFTNAHKTNECYWTSLLAAAQVLLEQGHGFSSRIESFPVAKLALGPFLVMGIILSSAYKNDNVYNIALPREPIPYETLGELVADEFEIYTRSGAVMVIIADLETDGKIIQLMFSVQ